MKDHKNGTRCFYLPENIFYAVHSLNPTVSEGSQWKELYANINNNETTKPVSWKFKACSGTTETINRLSWSHLGLLLCFDCHLWVLGLNGGLKFSVVVLFCSSWSNPNSNLCGLWLWTRHCGHVNTHVDSCVGNLTMNEGDAYWLGMNEVSIYKWKDS